MREGAREATIGAMDEARVEWSIRPMRAEEIPLLRNSLFLSARDANQAHRDMPHRVYSRYMQSLTDDLLAAFPDVLVADADGLVIGYAIGLPTDEAYVVPFVYVKSHSRRQGVAMSLVAALAERAGELPLVAGMLVDRHAARIARVTPMIVDLEEVLAGGQG